MNCQVHRLPELETATSGTREALQAIIHTILFIRSPGPVAPYDVQCESFQLTYTRIATDADSPPIVNNNRTSSSRTSSSLSSSPRQFHYKQQHQQFQKQQQQHPSSYHKSDLDRKVDDSIETFLRTLTPIGPELMAGNLGISFFERRTKNKLFGLVNQEEKVVWEQWILRVVVNNTPRPMGEDEASVIERQRIQDTAEGMLQAVLLKVFELAGSETDHIPPVMYEFEINDAKKADDRDEVYSRVSNLPALINLGS
ncbi:hypothetical protein ACHAWU_004907 [Discostella pseudostelligera]|uniref:Autophagy-related protein 101 n=1 Tax=Discostella pseudostelligera TaxID=259834 RepID=A0ABD3MCV7_9STRA